MRPCCQAAEVLDTNLSQLLELISCCVLVCPPMLETLQAAMICQPPGVGCTCPCRVISNLDFKVSDEDVKELFEAFGPIKRSGVIYDRR